MLQVSSGHGWVTVPLSKDAINYLVTINYRARIQAVTKEMARLSLMPFFSSFIRFWLFFSTYLRFLRADNPRESDIRFSE